MPMMSEKVVWKRVAIVLSVLLVASLVLRAVLPADTTARVTSFALGGLCSIAVGYTVVDPRSSFLCRVGMKRPFEEDNWLLAW